MKNLLSKLKKNILEENFFRPKWYSVFINPYFINRRSLYSEIKLFAENVKNNYSVLDVGCGIKPYRNLFNTDNYVGIDIEGGGHSDDAKIVDKFYDGKSIPFSSEQFDNIICTQVLEHAEDPNALINECSRVIKQGGHIFISMPFMYGEHEAPYDYRRFTRFEHKRILEANGFTSVKINQTTGFFGTFGQLLSIYIFESITFRSTILKTLLSILILGPMQIISLLLDFVFRKSGPTMDYVVTAIKK